MGVEGELISKPYIDITLGLLSRFGIHVERQGYQRFDPPQGSSYRSPGTVHVEADASSRVLLRRPGRRSPSDAEAIRSAPAALPWRDAVHLADGGADVADAARLLGGRRRMAPTSSVTCATTEATSTKSAFMRCTIPVPSSIRLTVASMSAAVSLAAAAVRWARLRTSSATTAKPRRRPRRRARPRRRR